MSLPIGESFEYLIKALKTNLGGFFESVNSTIEFAIKVLEKTLALGPDHYYPIIIITLLIGLLVYALARKHFPKIPALSMGIAVVVGIGIMETQRQSTLNEMVAQTDAMVLKTSIEQYTQTLQATPDAESSKQGIRLAKRVASRLERVNDQEKKHEVIGASSYDRFNEHLTQIIAEGGPHAAQASSIREALGDFNPHAFFWYPWFIDTLLLALLAWLSSGRGLAVFSIIGLTLIMHMGFWSETIETLALVISATLFALCLGVPLGIASARNKTIDRIVKPILDFMQTMPAFVYLIPAVILFGLGEVPAAMATLIFAMPPAVRLTSLGIRGVPTEVVEAAQSFGATPMQMLFKAQLPIALPTILAGLNQTIMLALSMVVIGGMIGAGGLGEVVLSGITQLEIGLGFESGLSVVILAIYLDRLTQSLGTTKA